MHLSIIVPAYNEEDNLQPNIKKFINYLEKQNYDYEIIIINDGSQDNTDAIAKKLAAENKKIKFINNPTNQGKGAVVRQGLIYGQGRYRMFIDADGATSIDHLDKVWPHFQVGCEVVIGSRNFRDAPTAHQNKKQAAWKRTLGSLGNLLIQFLTVPGIWDTQCGFKVLSQEAVENIIPRLKIRRWMFDVEILMLAKKKNYKIGIIPVVWNNSESSRVGVKGYFISLKEILVIRWNLFTGKYKF